MAQAPDTLVSSQAPLSLPSSVSCLSAMAAAGLLVGTCPVCRVEFASGAVLRLRVDVRDSCPVCLGELVDPSVLTTCGHVFCQSCIHECLSRSGPAALAEDAEDADDVVSEEGTASEEQDDLPPCPRPAHTHCEPVGSTSQYQIPLGRYCGWCDRPAVSWVRRLCAQGKWSSCCTPAP